MLGTSNAAGGHCRQMRPIPARANMVTTVKMCWSPASDVLASESPIGFANQSQRTLKRAVIVSYAAAPLGGRWHVRLEPRRGAYASNSWAVLLC